MGTLKSLQVICRIPNIKIRMTNDITIWCFCRCYQRSPSQIMEAMKLHYRVLHTQLQLDPRAQSSADMIRILIHVTIIFSSIVVLNAGGRYMTCKPLFMKVFHTCTIVSVHVASDFTKFRHVDDLLHYL